MSLPHAARPVRRSLLLAVLVAIGMSLVVVAVAFAILAIPFFALAQATEPNRGLARPFIRDGLFKVAIPVGTVVGIACGVAVGYWYRRGGRLPSGLPE